VTHVTHSPLRVVPLDAAHLAACQSLFETAASPCFCRYWHFEGTKNDWLARCALSPNENRDEQAAGVRAGSADTRGLLAFDGDVCVGWMKLTPRVALPKLRRLGVYRSLDLGPDDGVYAIGCFLVHPAHRGRGVARALVAGADDHVRAWGGRTIEAFPRHSDEPMSPEEAWQGPESVFVASGFEVVHRDGPYPVLRKRLVARET
jgi:GNAT superfamily N-acetyltransferase